MLAQRQRVFLAAGKAEIVGSGAGDEEGGLAAALDLRDEAIGALGKTKGDAGPGRKPRGNAPGHDLRDPCIGGAKAEPAGPRRCAEAAPAID